MEEEDEAGGGTWDPAAWTRYPLELDLGDLHAVADAAGEDPLVRRPRR